ncbi:MAG: hypothetical protein OXG78_07395 [Chloroflexi bacterium]|nr:hypothetical protein [Chloroflexota bacterium]
MIRLALYALAAGVLSAIIGAIGLFILTEGLPEGVIMGGILGGSIGILIAARIDARQSAKVFEEADPEAAKRSAALLSARERQIRHFHRGSTPDEPGMNLLRKLEDSASSAAQTDEETKR